uniref:C2H2-type domain-containing protein n=1 Tax=Mycena chlorophos TaxID=658473 RepID=A0ABQ0L9M5_MYCCL|nr:predicted protein [Mycena chlorophos]
MQATLLPSILPPRPAVRSDKPEQLPAVALGKITSPQETPLFICAFTGCFRLFPSRERLMTHRKRDHPQQAEETRKVVTWNE